MTIENRPLVSVIMCVFNTPQDYLNEAVLSILNQTYQNFELLIVDDNSDSNLYNDSIFADERIKIMKNDSNMGPSYSRNKALKISKGKYIAILDSDDISLSTRLEKQVDYLESNPKAVVVGTWFKQFGKKDNEVKRRLGSNDYYRCCLLFGNVPTLLNSSAMIRKQTLIDKNISYDESLRFGEDYKMWVELSQHGHISNLEEVLVKYRVHEKQVTYNNVLDRQKLKYDSKVKLLQLNAISNAFNEEEKDMFVSYYLDKNIKAKKYYKLLQKIYYENLNSLFLEPTHLRIRIQEQWKTKILNINNPFSLILLQIQLPREFLFIIKTKLQQLFKKAKKPNEFKR